MMKDAHMIRKIFPGLAITAGLATIFCLDPIGISSPQNKPAHVKNYSYSFMKDAGNNTSKRQSPPIQKMIERPNIFARSSPPGARAFHDITPPLASQPIETRDTDNTVLHWNTPAATARATPALLQAMEPSRQSTEQRSAPELETRHKEDKSLFVPMRKTMGKRVASGQALASLPASQQGVAKETYPPAYAVYPDRGLYAWGKWEHHDSTQKPRAGFSHYAMKGTTYSVGVLQDWTIDSSIGLSVDFIQEKVESLQQNDFRKNNLKGEIFNAHYAGTLLQRYPFDAKISYGRLAAEGTGSLGQLPPNPPDPLPWIEDKHRANLYGASANFGLPLMFDNGVKLLMELGIDYKKVRSKSYDTYFDGELYAFPKMDSTSITVPLVATIHKDYQQCWGIITPKVTLGWIKELDDTGDLARAYNASAAATMQTNTGYTYFDNGHKDFYKIGLGVDLKTLGGWDLRADYAHYWAEQYKNDIFKLELGRCF